MKLLKKKAHFKQDNSLILLILLLSLISTSLLKSPQLLNLFLKKNISFAKPNIFKLILLNTLRKILIQKLMVKSKSRKHEDSIS